MSLIQTVPLGGVGDGTANFPAGGTAGQALVKKSDADNDIEWADIENSIQVTTMPELSNDNYGKVYQYIGETTQNREFEQGCFYLSTTNAQEAFNSSGSNILRRIWKRVPNDILQARVATQAEVDEAKANFNPLTMANVSYAPKGGTTGQILQKKSNTDGDTQWVDGNILNLFNFSTTEKLVGKWIDGYNLYCKVYQFGSNITASGKSLSHGISNLKNMVFMFGQCSNGSWEGSIPLPGDTGASNPVVFYREGAYIYCKGKADLTGYNCNCVCFYTKTTG